MICPLLFLFLLVVAAVGVKFGVLSQASDSFTFAITCPFMASLYFNMNIGREGNILSGGGSDGGGDYALYGVALCNLERPLIALHGGLLKLDSFNLYLFSAFLFNEYLSGWLSDWLTG